MLHASTKSYEALGSLNGLFCLCLELLSTLDLLVISAHETNFSTLRTILEI